VSGAAPSTELDVTHAPFSTLGRDLRADLLARHPEAGSWGALRATRAFLGDRSLRAVFTVRLVLRTPGRFLFLWRTWNIALYRMEIFRIEIGPGLHLPEPRDILIGPGTRIGSGATIGSNVNIGFARAPEPGQRLPCPTIGDDVTIGAGTTIAGEITIGSGATIAPGSLVTRDVPPGGTVEAKTA
jgi:serine acetyltransferase